VFTLGPFLNLVMVLILTQEAPYNLALTTIGTDGVRLQISAIVHFGDHAFFRCSWR
jgi:hypothetical protein